MTTVEPHFQGHSIALHYKLQAFGLVAVLFRKKRTEGRLYCM